MENFQILFFGTPNSSFFRTKTRLNDVFAMDLALRNGEYKERSGNQVFNGRDNSQNFKLTGGL